MLSQLGDYFVFSQLHGQMHLWRQLLRQHQGVGGLLAGCGDRSGSGGRAGVGCGSGGGQQSDSSRQWWLAAAATAAAVTMTTTSATMKAS